MAFGLEKKKKNKKTSSVKSLTPEEFEAYKQAGANVDQSDVGGTPEYAKKQQNEKYKSLNTGMTPTDPLLENSNDDKNLGDFIKTGGQSMDVITDIKNNDTAMEANDKAFDEIQSGEATMGTPKMKERAELEQEKVETKAAEELDKKSDSEVKEDLVQAIEETDSPEVESKFKSIWQAWLDKDISKSDRNYLIIDALATFASNAGRNLRNIGAQYTGGTIDTSHDTSIWEQQNKAKTEEMAKLGTRAGQQEYTSKDLANEAAALSNEYQKMINEITPEKLQLEMEAAKQQLEALGLANEYQAIINSRTPEQLDRNIEIMVQKIEENDINLQNMKYSQAYVNHLDSHYKWIPDIIKKHMISRTAQKGVGSIGETIGNVVGTAAKIGSSFLR